MGNLDPWVCHDCGDCSVVCPRQAEPRISMQTLRRFLSAQYDWTGIASRLLQSKAWYLGSLISVALIVLLHDRWLPRVVRRDGAEGFRHYSVWVGSHVPAHDVLHADGDPASAIAFVFACLPYLAAHHEWRKARCAPRFLSTSSRPGPMSISR